MVPRRVFIDVTLIARHNRETGIQRVVMAVTREMRAAPRGHAVQAVRWQNGAFWHSNWPHGDDELLHRMELGRGDVFLGLDLSFDAIRRSARHFLRQRRAGAVFWFVVYDMLPIGAPRFFSSKVVTRFRWWLIATAKVADGYACISQSTADELERILVGRLSRRDRPELAVIPMGFDSLPDRTPKASGTGDMAAPFVLAVGTIEPRKAYSAVLDAFDVLWGQGSDATLTIVGAPGWKTEALQRRLRGHREFGVRLFWRFDMKDSELSAMYDRADLLIAASFGEGYGLPVVEAAAHGCPVLARDIPVFREHADCGLRYFPRNSNAEQIAAAIDAALTSGGRPSFRRGAASAPQWRDTADAVWGLIDRDAIATEPPPVPAISVPRTGLNDGPNA